MKFNATIKNSTHEDIGNEIPHHIYTLISETLLGGINALNKYGAIPFDRFFASCIHNLILEIAEKSSVQERPGVKLTASSILMEFEKLTLDAQKKRSFSAIEKFLVMIITHPAVEKGPNFHTITEQLSVLIRAQTSSPDEATRIPEWMALVAQYQIPGITCFEINKTPEPARLKIQSIFKQEPITLTFLYRTYSMQEGDVAKLLRAIAQRGNTKHLEALSVLTPIADIINAQSPTGQTALHWLIKGAQTFANRPDHAKYQITYQNAYQWLIDQGADISILNNEHQTPLACDTCHWFETSKREELNLSL